MIKPWQKAALSVLASLGIYGILLHSIEANTRKSNHDAALIRAEKEQYQLLETELKKQQVALVQLHLALTKEHAKKLQIEAKMADARSQIDKLKSGIQVAAVHVSNAQHAAAKVSVPTPSVTVSNPPPVQATTKASGA
ncbi:hypothetical protein [Alicyclobacillus sp. SO9]|uniref:hypothetical protein n=1 Tax=Alicyclobacillus sp. SO9 TaxID=2665646 RepID=UPI0018E8F534|nr:hypothetical protein [Alicyclobacillus sp. SO9]QQE79895.1 hypothetical protein GI364_05270 [Alicyclobacillus sp. SO9]